MVVAGSWIGVDPFDAAGRGEGAPGSGIIVASDTVVECGGEILGKPRDERRARQMLELLSGKAPS